MEGPQASWDPSSHRLTVWKKSPIQVVYTYHYGVDLSLLHLCYAQRLMECWIQAYTEGPNAGYVSEEVDSVANLGTPAPATSWHLDHRCQTERLSSQWTKYSRVVRAPTTPYPNTDSVYAYLHAGKHWVCDRKEIPTRRWRLF